ncbi:hypothetical protein [Flavobacterium sp.]|uniref:hypothetical protein n=1 Tax=Flavobacterium sp. TaxID=239 RepID=UPI0037BF5573
MMEEILDIYEIEPALSFKKVDASENKQRSLTIHSKSEEVFALLNELQIPYKEKTIEEVLIFLFDRLLYEYMENQSCYTKETYNKFKSTFIYDQLQMLIYHTKSLMLWLYDDIEQIPRNCRSLYRKKEISPVYGTNYLEKYEHYKLHMEILPPEKLPRYFNKLVGLKHFSVRTKAIYHALVEELEIRDINYDFMLYGKERMFSYKIEIISINNKYKVIRQF